MFARRLETTSANRSVRDLFSPRCLHGLWWGLVLCGAAATADEPSTHRLRSLPGQVVYWADALSQQHRIKVVPESREHLLVLVTEHGEILPLVEDIRGRAFRRDSRLRKIPVEILARQQQGSPFLQVVKVFAVEGDDKFELDYWCEICSIAMFELKECDCCQGPIELRRMRVVEN